MIYFLYESQVMDKKNNVFLRCKQILRIMGILIFVQLYACCAMQSDDTNEAAHKPVTVKSIQELDRFRGRLVALQDISNNLGGMRELYNPVSQSKWSYGYLDSRLQQAALAVIFYPFGISGDNRYPRLLQHDELQVRGILVRHTTSVDMQLLLKNGYPLTFISADSSINALIWKTYYQKFQENIIAGCYTEHVRSLLKSKCCMLATMLKRSGYTADEHKAEEKYQKNQHTSSPTGNAAMLLAENNQVVLPSFSVFGDQQSNLFAEDDQSLNLYEFDTEGLPVTTVVGLKRPLEKSGGQLPVAKRSKQ